MMTPGQALKAAFQELQHEHRRAGRHSAAHKAVTVQQVLTDEDAQRVLEILLAGYRHHAAGTELEHLVEPLSINHARQPLALVASNGN